MDGNNVACSRDVREKRVMNALLGLLFWQGFIPEDSAHNLDYYIQDFHPSLKQFINRHQLFKSSLHYLRTTYPWILLSFMFLSASVIHPVAIYEGRDNVHDVVDNAYMTCIWWFVFFAVAIAFFQKDKFNRILNDIDKFSKKCKLDNEEQRQMLQKCHFICGWIFKLIIIGTFPLFSIGVLAYSIGWCLPYRKPFFRGWYPYDSSAYPAFEITQIVTAALLILIFFVASSLIAAIIPSFIYATIFLKISCNKFENIRKISMGNLKERKICEGKTRTHNLLSFPTERVEAKVSTIRINRFKVGYPGFISQGPRTRTQRYGQRNLRLQSNSHKTFLFKNRFGKIQPYRTHNSKYVVVSKEEVDKEMHLHIARFIRLHTDCLRFANNIGKLLEYLFVVVIAVNIILCGGTVMVFMHIEKITVKTIMQLCISIEISFIFLAYCMLANLVSDQSAAVGEALYASDWLEATPDFKRSMLIVMTRANIPVEFKPPGLEPLSAKYFSVIASLAYRTATNLMEFM